jgi:tetratricopeptide (TPR) repeat protein
MTWVALAGCQGLATSSLVMLEPPALVALQPDGSSGESVPPVGPGKPAPIPTRKAQPTEMFSPTEKATSAAPGSSEPRTMAQARLLLLKATACLEANDLNGAAVVLHRYLQAYPDSVLVRMQLGELCFKLDRNEEAQQQFKAALAEVIDPELSLQARLHGHSRLVDIALIQKDRFSEELHRGIGLALLAELRLQETHTQSGVSTQELLGKARSALQKAKKYSVSDARPSLYLISVWQMMQQQGNAQRELAQAQLLSHVTRLTPYEQCRLAKCALELRAENHISLNR